MGTYRSAAAALALLATLAPGLACAQAAPADGDRCKDVLADGIYDSDNSTRDFKQDTLDIEQTCSRMRKDVSGQYKMTGGTYKEAKEACEKREKRSSISDVERKAIRTASAVIVEAWKQCMGDQSRKLSFGLEQSKDKGTVFGHLRHGFVGVGQNYPLQGHIEIPTELDAASCKCDSLKPQWCVVSGNRIKLDLPQNARADFSCRRKSGQELRAKLVTGVGDDVEVRLASVMNPDLGLSSPRQDLKGRCLTGPLKHSNKLIEIPTLAVAVSARDLPTDSLPVTLRSSGPGQPWSAPYDLYKGCAPKAATCTTELTNIELSGAVNKQAQNGLWLDSPHAAGGALQLIGQQGNANCQNTPKAPGIAGRRIGKVTIAVDRTSSWAL